MTTSYLAGTRPRIWLTLLASAAMATTGCSNMTSTATGGAATAAVKVGGHIHGGNQPVSGATVSLYFADRSTLGAVGRSGAIAPVATTTSSTDGFGSFSFPAGSFSCPAAPNASTYVYVVATGGTTVNTPNAGNNSDAEFIAPVGACDQISSSTNIYMSEVVTVATMAAIHNFMDPGRTTTGPNQSPIYSAVGSDGIQVATQGLTNAFNNVSSMVSLTNGLANTSLTRIGGAGTVTVVPEYAKLNQLANIISSCINQPAGGSQNCQTIYANAVPPASASTTSLSGAAFPTPAPDLLTALYYIFTNPTNTQANGTSTLSTLYALSPTTGAPYQPTLTAVPSDWTIGVTYTSTSTCGTSGSAIINSPADLAIDLNGQMWVANNGTSGSLTELTFDGTPNVCNPLSAGPVGLSAKGVVVDAANNIWVGSSNGNFIFRYPASVTNPTPTLNIPTPGPVAAVTADGYGDVFFATTAGDLYELTNAATLTTSTAVPVKINSITLGNPSHIMIDTFNRIFSSSGMGYITYTQGTVQGNALVFGTNATAQVSGAFPTTGIASTSRAGGGVYFAGASAGGGGNLSYVSNDSGTGAPTFSHFAVGGFGLSGPGAIALDGAQNAWITNSQAGNNLAEVSANATVLSPNGGFQKSAAYLGPQSSIVIDAAGNVWVGLTGSNTITEIVGGAVPVYQPFSNGLTPITPRFQTIP